MTGSAVVVLALAIVATVGFAVWWRRREGRVLTAAPTASAPHPLVAERLDPTAAVTVLLLTSPVCTRCPQARAVLRDVVATTRATTLAELDLTTDPALPAALGARSTPTTVGYDRDGTELFRIHGVPKADQLGETLRAHLPDHR